MRLPNPPMQANIPPEIAIEAKRMEIYLYFTAGIIPKATPKAAPDIPPQIKPCFICIQVIKNLVDVFYTILHCGVL